MTLIQIDRPISKFTAAITIIGGLGSLVYLGNIGLSLPTESIAILGGTIGSAATFLFMADKDKDKP